MELELKDGRRIKVDNVSLDGKMGFVEKGHKYIYAPEPEVKYVSVTQCLAEYKDKFMAVEMAKKVTSDPRKEQYFGRDWEEVVKEWSELGKKASKEGTRLHRYGEELLNEFAKGEYGDLTQIEVPSNKVKARHVYNAVDELINKRGYKVAKTELLLYDPRVRIAGQSDIILKKEYIDMNSPANKALIAKGMEPEKTVYYMIYDWKFLKEALQKKSFYNYKKRRYKMMKKPFQYLYDSNWIHYSIQLAIYEALLGLGEMVKEKVLIVVTNEGYKFEYAYPMTVYWDRKGSLQAIYEIPMGGRWYVSEIDKIVNRKINVIRGKIQNV